MLHLQLQRNRFVNFQKVTLKLEGTEGPFEDFAYHLQKSEMEMYVNFCKWFGKFLIKFEKKIE